MQPWVEEVRNKYQSGISIGFILSLNVDDYVETGVTLRRYLAESLLNNREVLAFYDRARGINFPLPSMKDKFENLLNLQPDPVTGRVELPRPPAPAMALLTQLLKIKSKSTRPAAVIIEYAETLIPAADIAMMVPEDRNVLVTIESWAKDPEILESGNPIFLITSNLSDLHQSVRAASSKYEAIRIPMPNLENRLKYIQYQYEKRDPLVKFELDEGAVARAAAGLSLINIEDIFLRANQEKKLTWELIKERKKEIMKSEFNDVLEVMEPTYGFEMVGGLDLVKDYFLRNVIAPMKEGDYASVPMGVLLLGPPGTGKTILAEAVAKESGMNMAILNLAKIYSKWVGDSERNLERALEAINSLSPIIVFMDEVDAALPNRNDQTGGDSGVSSRIFKRMLEYMSDTEHRGKIFFIGASNRPDKLDAALKRPGRFDTKIPLLVPNADSRLKIFEVMNRKYQVGLAKVEKGWVDATQGWTGAEIEKLMIKARTLVRSKKMLPLAAVAEAFTYILPKTEEIERMSQLAVDCSDDLEYVPREWWPSERQRRNNDEQKQKINLN